MTPMKAIKIDATYNLISEVEVADFNDISKHGGFDIFTTGVRLENGDTIWVDDEGALKGDTRGFFFNGQSLYGNGIVCGGDNYTGESHDVQTTMADIAKQVEFLPVGKVFRITF
tara:strand:- start:648 stop:989 length:342 start_codon:yes stop_codon:yes gene_type:complete